MAAVRFILRGDTFALSLSYHLPGQLTVSQKERKVGKLDVIVSAVVVLCVALADAVRDLLQPFDVVAKPLFHSLLVFRAPVFGTLQQPDPVNFVQEVLPFTDS